MLNTPIRLRLTRRATLDAHHRRLTYEEIADLEGIGACRRTLTIAFEKEQYHRRVATEKPLLTEAHKTARLAWARIHIEWTEERWIRVIWTDEASIKTGFCGQVYVTRQIEEKYLDTCCIPKFRGYSSWMIWGSISGNTKGLMVVFEKDWGTINGDVYRQRIVPVIHQFKAEKQAQLGFGIPPILMEDGASIHTAQATQDLHQYLGQLGLLRMKWPANSPDLNPIENIWRLLKYRVGKRYPKTADQVRQYFEEEWDKMTVFDITKYTSNMKERCQAVIDAEGGHTKW